MLGSHLLHVHVFALALRSLDGEDEEGVEHGEGAERDEAHDEEVEPAEVDLVVHRVLRQLRLVHTQARHVGDGVLQLYDTHTAECLVSCTTHTAQRFIQLYDTHSTAVYSAVRHTQHSGLFSCTTHTAQRFIQSTTHTQHRGSFRVRHTHSTAVYSAV